MIKRIILGLLAVTLFAGLVAWLNRESILLYLITNTDCPSPLNLGQIDLSGFGGSGGFEDGSEAVFG